MGRWKKDQDDDEYRREQYRRLYAKRSDGLVVKKYSPEQWQLAESMLTDGEFTLYEIAQVTGMSYSMVRKIASGNFAFGSRLSE